MRPHDAKKGKRAAVRAARNYLRSRLGWLKGYPEQLRDRSAVLWHTVPPPGSRKQSDTLEISRELLRRSEYSRNAARRRFPNALEDVVDDVGDWTRSTDTRLAILKAAVHDSAPLPDLDELLTHAHVRRGIRARIKALGKGHAAIKPFLIALVWLNWDDANALQKAISILEVHKREITNLLDRLPSSSSVSSSLCCLELIAAGSDPWFLELLMDRRVWDTPLGHGSFPASLQKCLNALKTGNPVVPGFLENGLPRPEARFAPDLLELVTSLASSNEKVRNRQLRLLRVLIPANIADDWEKWWKRADGFEREAKRLVRDGWAKIPLHEQRMRKALAKQISAELARPPSFKLPEFAKYLDTFSGTGTPLVFDALIACLETLPDNLRGRSSTRWYLRQWHDVFRNTKTGWRLVARLLKAQQCLLEQLPADQPDRHEWVLSHLPENLIASWIEENRDASFIEPALAGVLLLIQESPSWDDQFGPFEDYFGWTSVVDAVELAGDPEQAAKLVGEVPTDSFELHGDTWKALLQLAGCCASKFDAMAKTWRSHAWRSALCDELLHVVKDAQLSAMVAAMLLEGEGKRLTRLLALSGLCRSLGVRLELKPPDNLPPQPGFAEYPSELLTSLRELELWDRNALQAADQILSADFPQHDQLRSELRAVQDMIDNSDGTRKRALNARARKLERQLTEHPSVSEQRLLNYQTKLERRVHHARLVEWERLLIKGIGGGLEINIGVPLASALFEKPDTLLALSAFNDLEPAHRQLAFRLVRARCGPEPWDLRDDRSNQAFLNDWRQRGYRTDPWLDGIGERYFDIGEEAFVLALENDPMEILQMGLPFATCLSPGSFNFFAAVSNAADINKRVVYVRDSKGAIHGRCLLALTEEGHLLTFHVYAHAHHETFRTAIEQFVQDLSAEMGNSIVGAGQVQNLVATDWYDDGPVDLTGQLKFLEPGTSFEKTLKSIELSDLVAVLEDTLDGHPITTSVVCLLANSVPFIERPELIVPLLPFLKTSAVLDPSTRIALAHRVHQTGDVTAANDLIKPVLQKRLDRDAGDEFVQNNLAGLLIAMGQPQKALAVIRRSRPGYVKNWHDENAYRTRTAGDAYAGLLRPRKALELYRIAHGNGASDTRQRIREVEKRLGLSSLAE